MQCHPMPCHAISQFNILGQVSKDLIGMRFLAGLVGKIFPEYQYTWLFPDFEETIGLELGESVGASAVESTLLWS